VLPRQVLLDHFPKLLTICIRSLSQLAQRGQSRGLNTPPQVLAGSDPLEHMAVGQLETDSQTNSWDPERISRSSSVAYPEDAPPGSKIARTKEKGKGKKDCDKMISRVKEEPVPVTLPLFNNLSSAVTVTPLSFVTKFTFY
jgi:hypothetical protein